MPVEQTSSREEWDELEQLHARALDLLAGLDRLGLFQAGAHLAMAIEAMRQRHPNLSAFD
jgi:ABC-type transport system involved in cytochrome bd biosynthesis fused ATPase/permease subunit